MDLPHRPKQQNEPSEGNGSSSPHETFQTANRGAKGPADAVAAPSLSWAEYIAMTQGEDKPDHRSDHGHHGRDSGDSSSVVSLVSAELSNTLEIEEVEYDLDIEDIEDVKEIEQEELHVIDLTKTSGKDDHCEAEDSEAELELTLEEIQSDDEDVHNVKTYQGKRSVSDLRPGQACEPGQVFCPLNAVSKFPYRFLPQDVGEEVAKRLFNGGNFWRRDLDLYYLWPFDDLMPKPVILIPASVFGEIIQSINTVFPHLELNSQDPRYKEIGLLLDFPDHLKLSPRYLGTCSSKDESTRLTAFIPPAQYRPPDEMAIPEPDDDQVKEFVRQVEAAKLISRNKITDRKIKSLQAKIKANESLGKQLLRTQRYLGLTAKSPEFTAPGSEQQAKYVDIDAPPPFPFEEDLVIISFDCEAYETGARQVTEVGFASLDTRDIIEIAPGDRALGWYPHICARHLRIAEHAHLVNSQFLKGCPDKFEYGDSEFVAEKDAPRAVAQCFRPPFARLGDSVSANHQDPHDPFPERTSAPVPAVEDRALSSPSTSESIERRKILLVGHAPMHDVSYLKQLGYDVTNLTNIHEMLDTAQMWRTYRQESSTSDLRSLMAALNLSGNPGNLHNAGNDATYTMMCFLALAVKAAVEPVPLDIGSKEHRDSFLKKKMEAATEEYERGQAEWKGVYDEIKNTGAADAGAADAAQDPEPLPDW